MSNSGQSLATRRGPPCQLDDRLLTECLRQGMAPSTRELEVLKGLGDQLPERSTRQERAHFGGHRLDTARSPKIRERIMHPGKTLRVNKSSGEP
jgi:hypothetical protein